MSGVITNVLTPLVVIGSFATGVILTTKILTDYFLRKRMVDKGLLGDQATAMLQKAADDKMGPLKWGLIILFGGIGLILISALDLNPDSVLPFGVFAVSLSLGFLVYFFVGNKLRND